jgi:hypothetical protein
MVYRSGGYGVLLYLYKNLRNKMVVAPSEPKPFAGPHFWVTEVEFAQGQFRCTFFTITTTTVEGTHPDGKEGSHGPRPRKIRPNLSVYCTFITNDSSSYDLGTVGWNGGMERWDGTVGWNGGMSSDSPTHVR